MTPARQPHRQRCETCKHYNDETETEYGMCYAESGHREQMYNNTFDHVAKYGCASHSSATHTPAASAERLCDECNIIEVEDRLMELEQQVKAERERVLDEKYQLIRNVINIDQSGLAEALTKIRALAKGYDWIPNGEWGSYDYTKRTIETLQKECGFLLAEIEKISYEGLRDSGERVNKHIKSVEESLRGEQR